MYSNRLTTLFTFLSVVCIVNYSWAQTNLPPAITAIGDQLYCPLSEQNVVTDFNIVPGTEEIDAVFIQISENYNRTEDILTLTGTHPNVSGTWKSSEGKLTLTSLTPSQTAYLDLITAVKEVVFESTSNTISGEKHFSFTIDEANFLPSNGHFYEFVPDIGISWTAAKTAAESKFHYGLQGYLATVTSIEEAKITGEQSLNFGWIGGSDSEIEGTWKWMTGPENGTIFWNGLANGSTPNFAFWNTSEPNQAGDEDYAHVTAPGVGINGSWNDLAETGDPSPTSDYHPQGYIVEYGGMPGDPILNISASTKISVPEISSITEGSTCGEGTVTLSATATLGTTILWFDSLTGGSIDFGPNFTTPFINTTTTYYVLASSDGICDTGKGKEIIATVYDIPTINLADLSFTTCEGSNGILHATASSPTATINWYDDLGGFLNSGNTLTVIPTLPFTTYYVDATENGCTSLAKKAITLEILNNNSATIANISLDDITIIDDSNNNIITIHNNPEVNYYEYSLDSFENFQENPFFEGVVSGNHTLYIRDKNNCSISPLDVYVLGYPKFFTPNGDGENDFWQLRGLDTNFYPTSFIYIFNRFGKLITQINPKGEGWDGNFNGEMLPSSDYWFSVQLIDENGNIREKKGHFSLIRR